MRVRKTLVGVNDISDSIVFFRGDKRISNQRGETRIIYGLDSKPSISAEHIWKQYGNDSLAGILAIRPSILWRMVQKRWQFRQV